MSYCRWSSDDFDCDLYIYESARGFETHVAGNRLVSDVRKPSLMDVPEKPFPDFIAHWVDHHAKVMDWVETANREDIGLPHDGEHFIDATAEECRDRALELRALGYRFPDYVIETLSEDASSARGGRVVSKDATCQCGCARWVHRMNGFGSCPNHELCWEFRTPIDPSPPSPTEREGEGQKEDG